MKQVYIKDIKNPESKLTQVNEKFMVRSCEVRQAQASGKPYLHLMLQDKTGSIPAKIWASDRAINPGTIIKVSAKVDVYNNAPQLIINSADIIMTPNLEDFLETSPFTAATSTEKTDRFMTMIQALPKTEWELFLLKALFNKDCYHKFIIWPAAISHHGNYRLGLLDHTMAVVKACKWYLDYYKEAAENKGIKINERLLLMGAIIHDYGKIFEYTYDGETGVIGKDEEHDLMHINVGQQKLAEQWGKYTTNMDPTPEDRDTYHKLQRFIVTHHGYKTWGSSINPVSFEELILHHVDHADSDFMDCLQGNKPDFRPIGG